uniref:DUF755 domain-containing protein n=1 Tax=Torque teno mini virus 10 TaxID=2065036 RepID=A0A3S8RKE8_9VIRU|nr:hypothetical protein ORF3 [Torque teno mini virus 10]
MKSKIQKQKNKHTCMTGTKDDKQLRRAVQKELQGTQHLQNILQEYRPWTSHSKHREQKAKKRRHRKKRIHHYSSSSSNSSEESSDNSSTSSSS